MLVAASGESHSSGESVDTSCEGAETFGHPSMERVLRLGAPLTSQRQRLQELDPPHCRTKDKCYRRLRQVQEEAVKNL